MTEARPSYDYGAGTEDLAYITIGDMFKETRRRFSNNDALVDLAEGVRFTCRKWSSPTA